MDEELIEFADAGADLVLTKPLRPQQLAIIIDSLRMLGTVSKGKSGEKLILTDDELMWTSSSHSSSYSYRK